MILDLIRVNQKNNGKEITEALGNITEHGVKYHLNKLKREGKIEKIGGDKGGYWKILIN